MMMPLVRDAKRKQHTGLAVVLLQLDKQHTDILPPPKRKPPTSEKQKPQYQPYHHYQPYPGTSRDNPEQTIETLTGVPAGANEQLPDLVLTNDDPDTSQATGAVSTEEEIDAAEALLSLGEVRDDTLDNDENAMLMPIGGPNPTVDVAPEPIKLDQVNVDKAIAELIQDDQDNENDETTQVDKNKDLNKIPTDADHKDTVEGKPKSGATGDGPTTRGRLKTKTYALKKNVESRKRTFKCSECDVVKKTIKELNAHHEESHNPQICGVCGKLFKLASSLARHMYEHNKPKFNCDQCDFMCQFGSELTTHKIVHRKNPSHQCMKVNCGKWFMRKWDLKLHLQKHDGVRHTCDHKGCTFYADTKKQLNEHRKKHSDDHRHICTQCGKGFKYRLGLKRHRDRDH